jgi:flagella basal body P-ring formation protein FlgA
MKPIAMTLRPTLSALLLGFGMLVTVAAAPRTAWGITTVLNEHVLVQDKMIHLGDLFDGLGDEARQTVGQAPAPGDQMVFDIQRLAAVAKSHNIDWRPRTWTDRVVIERTSQRISQQAIEMALQGELKRRGISRKVEFELANRGAELVLPTGVPATIAVQQFDYDERGGRFTAIVAAPADAPITRLSLQGRLYDLTEVPVLARRLNTGEVIRKGDIDWVSLRSDQINRNVLTDASRLIGQEVRRGVAAGQPVRASDVRSPIIVTKGSIVTMLLQTPKMQLTSKGRAMEDASMGDAVQIMNTQSKTVIEATVVGVNTVQVTPAAAMRSY